MIQDEQGTWLAAQVGEFSYLMMPSSHRLTMHPFTGSMYNHKPNGQYTKASIQSESKVVQVWPAISGNGHKPPSLAYYP